MRKLFDEYGVLLLSFICASIGFSFVQNLFLSNDFVCNILEHFIYGLL